MAPTFGLEADGRDAAARLSPRVRSTHPVIVAMLKEASARSATFRELVGGIERTDGIIYVEPGVCLHGVRACLSLSISGGSGFRILRVIVNLATDVVELMATIGHELQHALEILSDRTITTSERAYLFYAREAPTTRDAFETPAAIRVGSVVRAELEPKTKN